MVDILKDYISFMILMLYYGNKKLILVPSEQVNVTNLNYRTFCLLQ